MRKLILIVEDDKNQRQVIKFALNRVGFDVEEAVSGEQAMELLSCETASRYDLVLLDMVMGHVSGRDILNFVKDALPHLPVIVLTGHSSVEHAVEVMREGAIDFISKPVEVDRLKVSIENAFRMNKLSGEISRLSRKWSGQFGFQDMIGSSKAMKQAVELARKAMSTNIPILLEGESGVGKEVFARAIQGESDRSGKPFVVVNCGAIPHNLVESILFGHEKGAFTGALEKHMGKFVEADGGTLFLDEIGELPLELQVKLLRVLQEGEVDPVGGREPVKVDVRLISATNRDLKVMVEKGEFREDLFYRLNIFPIHLPPLRNRKSDIEHLAPHFIEHISISEGCEVKSLSPRALNLLKSYHWPGNVRQLENALFRAVILSEGMTIQPEDFPQIHTANGTLAEASEHEGDGEVQKLILDAVPVVSGLDEDGNVRPLQDVEQDLITYAMKKYDGRMSEVARRLGVGRSTLYRKVSELGLDEPVS
ncbi:sigma-54 dependent transcriptional regulator [Paremcibacter congregatus]|uniref:sigma-54-dependent transcriptional regulator n=1 Tax=Paremcibacter congregatus TaxID=2043170 RepID=UPI0030EC931A|tara:strand:+ start:29305 stop:30744 length:1440 start_codon:yes stop_codon:yes gene_type:complete